MVKTYPETKAVLLETHRDEMRALTSYQNLRRHGGGRGLPEDRRPLQRSLRLGDGPRAEHEGRPR